MNQVISAEPLERVLYIPHKGSSAEVYLRENITEDKVEHFGGKQCTVYSADEVHLRTYLSKDEVEASFDELWVRANIESTPLEERVSELEELVGILIDEKLGV